METNGIFSRKSNRFNNSIGDLFNRDFFLLPDCDGRRREYSGEPRENERTDLIKWWDRFRGIPATAKWTTLLNLARKWIAGEGFPFQRWWKECHFLSYLRSGQISTSSSSSGHSEQMSTYSWREHTCEPIRGWHDYLLNHNYHEVRKYSWELPM